MKALKEPKTFYEIRIAIDNQGNTEINRVKEVKSYYDEVPDEATYRTDWGLIRVLYFPTYAKARAAQLNYLKPLMRGKAVFVRKY